MHICLHVEPNWHPGARVLLVANPPATLFQVLAQLAQPVERPSWAGVALLTAVPPGTTALALPRPMTPYHLGPLWLCTTVGPSRPQ